MDLNLKITAQTVERRWKEGDQMQIVIKIPEWKYKSICEGIEAYKKCGVVGIEHSVHEAIYNGTPLPKGHGRLIDADALIDSLDASDRDIYCKAVIEEDAPTIIEADKAESE